MKRPRDGRESGRLRREGSCGNASESGGFGDLETVVETADVCAGESFWVAAGVFAFDNVKGCGVFDVVENLNRRATKPQADEIFAGLDKNFAEKEGGASGLAGLHGQEVIFLGGIGVDDAVAIRFVEDDSEVCECEGAFAFHFDGDREIASWRGEVKTLAD